MAEKILKSLCVFFVLPIIMLTACNNESLEIKSEKPSKAEIISAFSADFEADYRNSRFKGNVTANSQKFVTISITSPDTVAGLKINYRGGELHLVRDELVCSADEAYIPSRSLPGVIKSICDGVSRKEEVLTESNNREEIYNLKTDLGNAKLTASNGLITCAQIKDISFDIKFENTKILE